ncbi:MULTISPECIES: glycosyltransferase family 4 protein [Croceitalea]|uniref:MraY family glycosyltransferase n=1 Tax=Croceitalea vernalis TaxID=3075599 RepID=A0ABU3BEB4_9FLAO|nr:MULTISPECIES: MraY family glycosyltransferase [unclassified Croceitalea]MDT0538728.1 MraY family glycosyltransferase [Croceitalea sp. P059]MDT0620512.1 MraY family glycosyltransferase [Croceitalea sp. P007]
MISILFFIGSFLLTYLALPSIIKLVEDKRLMDNPNSRSSHKIKTPTLGGIAFFITLIFVLFFLRSWEINDEGIYIIPGLTILFFIGLKDDLVVLSPLTKIIAQILAVSFVLSNDSFMIETFNGFLRINEIPYYAYLVIGSFIMITIINAYNLIDGIDGLASIVGIAILILYTTIFYITKQYFFALLCVSLNGSLMAFFGYNTSTSSNKKIFMGDTGSLIVGYIISILTMKFLALPAESYDELPFLLENVPLIAISIIIVPLFDTARVFAIRLADKKSPFSPDRNHMHHVIVDYLNLSHRQASFLIGGGNIFFVVLFVILGSTAKNLGMVIMLVSVSLFIGYILFRYNYSFKVLKKKIILRNLFEKLTLKSKKNDKKGNIKD